MVFQRCETLDDRAIQAHSLTSMRDNQCKPIDVKQPMLSNEAMQAVHGACKQFGSSKHQALRQRMQCMQKKAPGTVTNW